MQVNRSGYSSEEEEVEEGPGDFLLAAEEPEEAIWASTEQRQQQLQQGGGANGDGGTRHTSAPPGVPMTLPFGLLHCDGARPVGAAPKCASSTSAPRCHLARVSPLCCSSPSAHPQPRRPGEPDMLDVRLPYLVAEGCTLALVMQARVFGALLARGAVRCRHASSLLRAALQAPARLLPLASLGATWRRCSSAVPRCAAWTPC